MRRSIKHKCNKVYTACDRMAGAMTVTAGWVGIVGIIYCAVLYKSVRDMRHHYKHST